MNNFIVGQVTVDMINGIRYGKSSPETECSFNLTQEGTFILFGCLITMGAAFIWFFVPETKQLTLEEMDIVFGSSGVAAADQARMDEINREVGLTQKIRGNSVTPPEEKVAGETIAPAEKA